MSFPVNSTCICCDKKKYTFALLQKSQKLNTVQCIHQGNGKCTVQLYVVVFYNIEEKFYLFLFFHPVCNLVDSNFTARR